MGFFALLVLWLLSVALEAYVYYLCSQAGFGYWGFFVVAIIGSLIAAVVRIALKD